VDYINSECRKERKNVMRYCSKCQGGVMEGETQQIPKQIPLPILQALAIPVENYLPYIMRKYHNYTVFIYTTCGNLQVSLS
jgi:hypothetical protein